MKCCDVTIDLKEKTVTPLANDIEDWKVTVVDVGKKTSTGGAIKKVQHLIGNEPFMFTYGDGLSNIDIDALISHHVRHKKMITISSITASPKNSSLSLHIALFFCALAVRELWVSAIL